jgi:two-component system OmpR family response regulator/two-component system response regulator QseB
MRVLVVEDDPGIAEGLRAGLRGHGAVVDTAGTLRSAEAALAANAFDIVLLDLGLPDGDGLTLLHRLRSARPGHGTDPQTPVLIMTARDEVASRISGLDLGADDYLPKPFDIDELAARMRALRRRAVGRARPTLRFGAVEIDPSVHVVRLDGRPVDLTAREFDVLRVLAEVSPRVLSRSQIEAALYELDAATPESNAVEVHVHRLRRKLGDGLIRTLRGVGYFVPGATSDE